MAKMTHSVPQSDLTRIVLLQNHGTTPALSFSSGHACFRNKFWWFLCSEPVFHLSALSPSVNSMQCDQADQVLVKLFHSSCWPKANWHVLSQITLMSSSVHKLAACNAVQLACQFEMMTNGEFPG